MSPHRADPDPLPDPAAEPWHFDRRVPVALICTILFQSAAIIWWASSVEHRVKANFEANVSQDKRIERLEDARGVLAERLSKIEQATSDMTATLARIDGKLDRVIIGSPPR